ncbi:hypothetical protein LWI28_021843 [Acer negundo]|uniref:Retrovirus-related Pol polyprotein from transposon TNT 1-94-like beta-barrel domain-containing protein n=1 Tax=Acer negundo TaxID=4023 RepID=A0AAD5IR06_ACENE|nr:hypothetical protein LWI28_021843 [Acer negundo]
MPLTSWVIDSGASIHATSRRDFFASYASGYFGDVKMGNNGVAKAVGMRDVCLETNNGMMLLLKNVKHILDIHLNLISVGKLDDEGFCNTFSDGHWKPTKVPLTNVPVQVRDEVQDYHDGTVDADTHTQVEIDDDIHEQSPVPEVPLKMSTRDHQPSTCYVMMVLEMVRGRKKPHLGVDNTSDVYFPELMYRNFELDEDIKLHGATSSEEMK